MRTGRLAIAAALGGAVLVAGFMLVAGRPATVRVSAGPVGQYVIARAAVVPRGGVRHVFAAADSRVLRVLARDGERVARGQLLAELDSGHGSVALTAPEQGVVLERHCELGDYALAAEHGAPQPLFELADPAQTELRVEVEEFDAAQLAHNQPVVITPLAAAQRSAEGLLDRIAARLERRSLGADDARVRADGLVRVASVAWRGEPPDWPLGARAQVRIEVQRRNAATRVPRAALSVRDGRTVVEQPSGLWSRTVPVEVVAADEAYAEVHGIPAGSSVVIRGDANGSNSRPGDALTPPGSRD
jgi:multidrug efflux pump subunit AcrA (membrane-fusion protein)